MLDEKTFGDQDDVLEEETLQDEDTTTEDEGAQEETTSKSFTPEQQAALEAKIRELTWRERSKLEKRLKQMFGTTDLEKAAEYYKAGLMVSQASGQPPSAVLQRLSSYRQQRINAQQGYPQMGQPGQAGDAALREELQEIKHMLASQYEQEVRAKEEATARKEFGNLFDEFRGDIEDLAEERGLSLVDAAAVVLRPKLRELYAQQTLTKQQVKRERKVESTHEPPDKGQDPASLLSPAEKRVAQKMGMSYKDYYEQKKALGRA